MEALRLCVKDVEFARREILVRDGKGRKDRITMRPVRLLTPMREQMEHARELHRGDLAERWGCRVAAIRAGSQVRERRSRVGLAIRLSIGHDLGRSARRGATTASPGGPGIPARDESRGAGGGHRQARHTSYAETLVRYAPSRRWLRHPHRAGAAGPQRSVDHHDLHARAQPSGRGVISPIDRMSITTEADAATPPGRPSACSE